MKKAEKLFMEAVTVLKPVAIEKGVENQFEEYKMLKRQFEILEFIGKRVGSRLEELENELIPITRDARGAQVQVDKAVIEFQRRKKTSVKYKAVFEKAMEIVNDDQRRLLEDYRETVTSRGISESLSLVDPELENFISGLRKLPLDAIMKKIGSIKKIPKKAPKFVEKAKLEGKLGIEIKADLFLSEQLVLISKVKNLIKKKIGKWITEVKNNLSKLKKRVEKAKRSSETLARIARENEAFFADDAPPPSEILRGLLRG